MIPEQIVILILKLFAGVGGIALVLLLTWVFYPEKIEKWAILLHKFFAYVSEKHERKYIAKHIESKINTHTEKLCSECKGALPYSIKIKWMKIDNVESELREGKLIVKMENHRNQSKNFAYAVREYVPNTLIPKARRYVEPTLMEGIDYTTSKGILSDDTRALSYFADIAEKDFDAKPELKQVVDELDTLHRQGCLTRIILSEFAALSKLYPSDPDKRIHQETVDFQKNVLEFATKEPEEDVDTRFNRKNMQVAIVPIARLSKLLTVGTRPHLAFIDRTIKEGINRFYVTAVGVNIPYAKELSETLMETRGFRKLSEDEYTGIYREKRRKMYCACLEKV